MERTVRDLPNALGDAELARRLEGHRPAVFLDYDGVLTPIVDRPDEAVMSESMQATVRSLAARCPVCVISGRDRAVVQQLMGIDELVVAGSHGFDIWSPTLGPLSYPGATDFEESISQATERLRSRLGTADGVMIEPKRASVAVHYRMAGPADTDRVAAEVAEVMAERPGTFKVMPGKKVYEIQPNIDWNKGRAVEFLLEALDLNHPDVLPLYLGDDITDEDAFRALSGRGVGILVAQADDPDAGGRATAADLVLANTDEVAAFLSSLAR